jgi:hypothetical protein
MGYCFLVFVSFDRNLKVPPLLGTFDAHAKHDYLAKPRSRYDDGTFTFTLQQRKNHCIFVIFNFISLEQIIIYCTFNRKFCGDLNEEFTWYYSYHYGNCFTFNSGYFYKPINLENTAWIKVSKSIKTVKLPGHQNQLNLELYIGNRDNKFSLEKHGSILFVHNQTSKPENAGGILLKVILLLLFYCDS